MKHLQKFNEHRNSNVGKTIEIITNKRKDSTGLEMEMDLTIGKTYKVVGTHLGGGSIDVIDDIGLRCEIRPYMFKWVWNKQNENVCQKYDCLKK
jgi:hypothetical protein